MTTTWASPASTRWCTECRDDTLFDSPAGPDSAEACCTECGAGVFRWVDLEVYETSVEVLAAAAA